MFRIGRAMAMLLALLGASIAGPQSAHAVETEIEKPVDFLQDVYPIFRDNCFHCHSANRGDGNLRLHERAGVPNMSSLGAPFFGGGEHNEFLRRVTTDDIDQRMPKGSRPLSPAKIDVIRRWVMQGSPWQDPEKPKKDPASSVRFSLDWDAFQAWNAWTWTDEGYQRFYAWRNALLGPGIGLVLFVLLCERAKTWRAQADKEQRSTSRLVRGLASVPATGYLSLLLLLVLGAFFAYYQEQTVQAERLVSSLEQTVDELKGNEALIPTEGRVRPVRPAHFRRFGGTYYRGNDERSDHLFNGGYYRTAEFHLSLIDRDGKPLHWGDDIDNAPISIRLEILQSPGASPTLFTDAIWDETFLSVLGNDENVTDVESQIAKFEKVAEGRWRADFPITAPAAPDSTIESLVYVHRGNPASRPIKASPHYAAELYLKLNGRRIDKSSELWLGETYRTNNVVGTPEGKIHADEWFSFRPIPEIEGPNSTDPKLLGIDEHVKEDPAPETEQQEKHNRE